MIYDGTISDMITNDLFGTNYELNVDNMQNVYYENSKQIEEIQIMLNKLINKMRRDYYECNMIGDSSEKWIVEEFGRENFSSSLQEIINYRIDKYNIHLSLEDRKELYLDMYSEVMIVEPDFMSRTYELKSECQNEMQSWRLR
jgi:L-lactate utilization protein LutB